VTERIKFTVYRDKWLRGGKNGIGETADAYLLDSKGCRCCLGFLGSVLGTPDLDMRGTGQPDELEDKRWPESLVCREPDPDSLDEDGEPFPDEPPPPLLFGCTKVLSDLMDVNDRESLTDAQRETRITELFASVDIDVTFTDGAGPADDGELPLRGVVFGDEHRENPRESPDDGEGKGSNG